MKILITGHSLIKRIRDDSQLDYNLGFADCEIYYETQGGAKINTLHTGNKYVDIIILQIGGNDISCHSKASVIAHNIVSLGSELLLKHRAKKLAICKLLYRQHAPRSRLDSKEAETNYNMQVDSINHHLKVSLESHPNIKFWKPKAIDQMIYMKQTLDPVDGTHLTKWGRYKYWRALRGAANFLKKQV